MDKDLDKLTNTLQKSKLKMDRSFTDEAEAKLKNFTLSNPEKESVSNNIFYKLSLMRKRNIFALSFIVVMSILALTIVSAGFYQPKVRFKSDLFKEETQRILAQIIKNNRNLGVVQNGIAQANTGSSLESTQSDASRKMASSSSFLPYSDLLNLMALTIDILNTKNIFGQDLQNVTQKINIQNGVLSLKAMNTLREAKLTISKIIKLNIKALLLAMS